MKIESILKEFPQIIDVLHGSVRSAFLGHKFDTLTSFGVHKEGEFHDSALSKEKAEDLFELELKKYLFHKIKDDGNYILVWRAMPELKMADFIKAESIENDICRGGNSFTAYCIRARLVVLKEDF